jgi:hypothetical protein
MTADRPLGPLPVLLVCLTVVTGLVDAFSYLRLGHVFVANMTGNVVFLGFGLAGVGEISIVASLFAVFAFALGAAVSGRWAAGERYTAGFFWLRPLRFRRAWFSSRRLSSASAACKARRCD